MSGNGKKSCNDIFNCFWHENDHPRKFLSQFEIRCAYIYICVDKILKFVCRKMIFWYQQQQKKIKKLHSKQTFLKKQSLEWKWSSQNIFGSIWDHTGINVTIKFNSVQDLDVYLSKKWVFRPNYIIGDSWRDHKVSILCIFCGFYWSLKTVFPRINILMTMFETWNWV